MIVCHTHGNPLQPHFAATDRQYRADPHPSCMKGCRQRNLVCIQTKLLLRNGTQVKITNTFCHCRPNKVVAARSTTVALCRHPTPRTASNCGTLEHDRPQASIFLSLNASTPVDAQLHKNMVSAHRMTPQPKAAVPRRPLIKTPPKEPNAAQPHTTLHNPNEPIKHSFPSVLILLRLHGSGKAEHLTKMPTRLTRPKDELRAKCSHLRTVGQHHTNRVLPNTQMPQVRQQHLEDKRMPWQSDTQASSPGAKQYNVCSQEMVLPSICTASGKATAACEGGLN